MSQAFSWVFASGDVIIGEGPEKETGTVTEQQWMTTYRETVLPLYGYMAKRTGGNRELTEDIVQESYLRALDDWRSKRVPELPLAWLKRVARNVLIDHLRQRRRDSKAAPDLAAGDGPRTPEDEFESLEIFVAISALGRKKARAIEAFYYDGLSIREIAAEMALSERAVEGLLRRARRSLKALLPEPTNDGGTHV
jgi:RNA polymerase sigma-70 factor (ECF subfamily)